MADDRLLFRCAQGHEWRAAIGAKGGPCPTCGGAVVQELVEKAVRD